MERESLGILLALALVTAAMTAFAEGAHTEAGATPGAAEAEYAVNPGPTDGQTAEIRSLAVRGLAGGGAAVDIALDSKVRYGLMELENPDRLIVDIPGGRVSRNVKRITEAPAGGISRIRVGAHQDKGRVVLDLDGGIPQYNVVNAGKRIRIFIAVKEGNAQISGLPFHKTDVAVSPAADMKPAKTASSIRDIQFRQYEGYSRVSIALSEAVSYKEVAVDQKTLALELPATLSKSELVRTLDVSEASGPVGSVSSFEDKARPGTAIIAVRLREATENRISMDGSTINWDFTRDREPAGKTAEVTEYAREKTAGATSITAISGGGAVSSKVYKGKRINLDFKEADIHNILRLVSDVSKLNIITSDDVRGKITLTLRNVPWDEALDIILQSKGLAMKQVGNILRIAPADVFQREAEAEFAKKKALRNLEPLYVRLIPVNYGVAQDIVNQVRDILSERGSVNIDTRTNVLIVKDMQENVIKAESLIRNLDTQTPQVLIESRIVEANTSFVRDVGIQWGGNITFSPATGNPTGLTFPSIVSVAGGADDSRTLNPMSGTAMPAGFAINMPSPAGAGTGGAIGFIFGSANGAFNLNLRLSAMESTGDVKILSAPRVTTLDNKEAKIGSGISIPISTVSAAGVNTVFVEAKLELSVTPHVTQDGSILMKIHTAKNEPDFSRTGAQGDPTILKKEATTEVLVKDGDTTVIGGIYTRKNSEEYAKVPLLANIPVLGWLFKKKKVSDERTELLIFITPRIINRSQSSVSSSN